MDDFEKKMNEHLAKQDKLRYEELKMELQEIISLLRHINEKLYCNTVVTIPKPKSKVHPVNLRVRKI